MNLTTELALFHINKGSVIRVNLPMTNNDSFYPSVGVPRGHTALSQPLLLRKLVSCQNIDK